MIFGIVFFIASYRANADVMRVSEVLRYRVVAQFPHDIRHYTQGLEWHDGRFIESAGGYGVSALFAKKRANGETLRSISLPADVFAEGITKFRDRVFLLTWRERVALVFDDAFREQKRLRYDTEGWGLTNDDRQLIMSDGSARLTFRDPESFETTRTIVVTDSGAPVMRLNELEYVRGHVLANVWQTSRIAMIDPSDGQVRAWLELAALEARLHKQADWDAVDNVLNGIAYDRKSGHLYVTGKRWPLLFELAVDWPKPAKR